MKEKSSPIIKEGFYLALIIFSLSIFLYLLGFIFISITLFFLALFVLFFFRNPRRIIPDGKETILSPADGKIVDIKKIREEMYLKREMISISIFLSIFNVHINRAPYLGVVKKMKYSKGRFFPAFQEKASLLNEHNSILISYRDLTILVRQIAGVIARRVVCWVKEGDYLDRGQRLGFIRFGSRVDILLPLDTEVMVRLGDRVRGGETIIGRLNLEEF